MINVSNLKEVKLAHAEPAHLLLLRQQGDGKFAILVDGTQELSRPMPGLVTLPRQRGVPSIQWLNPMALDTRCVDLGPFELVFAPHLEAFSLEAHNDVPGTLIIEGDGPALICEDHDGLAVRIGIEDWHLRATPAQSPYFCIREWQLVLSAAGTFDIIYAQGATRAG